MSNGANNKIEITQSTLLKLLIRRGSNAERQNIVLSEGELGYTVDTQKLFVGDGATTGGIPVTLNVYYAANAPTVHTQAVINELAYDSTAGKLYLLTGTDPTNASNWTSLLTDVRVDNATMLLSTFNGVPNVLSVKTVSAAQLDANLAGLGLAFNGNKIQTTANQTFDSINVRTAAALQMPATLKFGTVGGASQYTMPSFDGVDGYSLVTNGNGILEWKPGNSVVNFAVLSGNQVPAGTIVQFGSGGSFAQTVSNFDVPYGYLLCNGATLLSANYVSLYNAISTFYGSTSAGNFKVPALTAANAVYLIKYLEDKIVQPVTISLESSLTGLNLTNSTVVTSFAVPQLSAVEFKLGVLDYVSKTYVDSLNIDYSTKVKRLITGSEPNGPSFLPYACTIFIDSRDRVRFAGYNHRGISGINNSPGNNSEFNAYMDVPLMWDASSNEYEIPIDVYGAEGTTFVVTNSGRIWSAGDNVHGTLGRGTIGVGENAPYDLVSIPAAAGKVTKISIGGGWWAGNNTARHAFALTESGSAFGWGYNNFGQLGIGNTTSISTPVCVNTGALSGKQIKKIYSFCGWAYGHSFAIDVNNNVYATGYNSQGALATGDTTNRTFWVQLTAFTADEIYGSSSNQGYQQTFLLSAGRLWGAGRNSNYELGLNNTTNPVTTFTPVCANATSSTQLSGVSSLALGDGAYWYTTNYALMQDGTMRAWGRNAEGQCGIGNYTTYVTAPTGAFSTGSGFSNTGIVKIKNTGTGPYCTIFALNSAGNIWVTGFNGQAGVGTAGSGLIGGNINAFSRVFTPYGIKYKDMTAFTTGNENNLTLVAVDTKNDLYGWGDNSYSQLAFDEAGSVGSGASYAIRYPIKLKIEK